MGIAREVADGRDVDWDGVRRQLEDEASDAVLSDLQAVDQIAAFHRGNADSSTSTAQFSIVPGEALGTWRHLTLVEKIAEGAFGSVYRAHDPKLQTDVALKLVRVRAGGSVDGKRALKEARLLARVQHPHVVRVHGADIVDGQVGMWMDFVEGQTLATLLQAQGRFGASEAALIGVALCQARAAVHSAGLVHGDVKAQNVMREAGGRTVLMDFGTGKDLQTAAHAVDVSDVAGTPLYIAPEVFQGAARSRVPGSTASVSSCITWSRTDIRCKAARWLGSRRRTTEACGRDCDRGRICPLC
jgi:serine/threonine protein kinase